MQWWCAALGEQWTWSWRAYPGVWLFVIAVVAGFGMIAGRGAWTHASKGERASFVTGTFSLWLTLDWPIGPIAAGYLASAHALQFVILTMISAPLLLYGVRSSFGRRLPLTVSPSLAGVGRTVAHPLVAAIIFNAVVAATHVPGVVDSLMPTPLGAFAVDAGWFFGAVIYWWSVIMPAPRYSNFGPPLKILYLLVGTLFHTVIGMIMLSAELPLYGIYELAPRIVAMSPRTDQQLGGGIMELGVFAAIVVGTAILFFRWAGSDEKRS